MSYFAKSSEYLKEEHIPELRSLLKETTAILISSEANIIIKLLEWFEGNFMMVTKQCILWHVLYIDFSDTIW